MYLTKSQVEKMRPLKGRFLIELVEDMLPIGEGIIEIPENVKQEHMYKIGKVLAFGTLEIDKVLVEAKDTQRSSIYKKYLIDPTNMGLEIGDLVLFFPFAHVSHEFFTEDKKVYLVRWEDVLLKLEYV